MTDTQNPERSLLDEIEELQVLEAQELQEGVAFHAFRFHAAQSMEAIVLTLKGGAANAAAGLELPQGATLTDVEDGKLRVLFDHNAVPVAELQASLVKALGNNLSDIKYNEVDKFKITKI